jgi:DNA-binding NarL/FixJ family response regulator
MKSLTNKELEVLNLVSTGLTTKQIAHQLNVSHHTVESHRKSLLKKCSAKNTAELIYKNLQSMTGSENTLKDSLHYVRLV